jgi:hypothetical protein
LTIFFPFRYISCTFIPLAFHISPRSVMANHDHFTWNVSQEYEIVLWRKHQ